MGSSWRVKGQDFPELARNLSLRAKEEDEEKREQGCARWVRASWWARVRGEGPGLGRGQEEEPGYRPFPSLARPQQGAVGRGWGGGSQSQLPVALSLVTRLS